MKQEKCFGLTCPIRATCWHFRAHEAVEDTVVEDYLTPTVEDGKCMDYEQIEYYGN